MGAWSVSITGNDTAEDLLSEYTAAFFKYEPEEAVHRIDQYVRENMFDESDEEEWCDYYYSLADFMWKKGILTDEVKDNALRMIDSGFGLQLWAEAGEKTLEKRKKVLAEFRDQLTSPMPEKKKIRPKANTERIFENGDVIAVQLQTAGKPYTKNDERSMTDDAFHAFDGKYIVMQLIGCHASWTSSIVPEVKDYWAYFRLFDGVYDTVPKEINVTDLKPAKIHEVGITSCFMCESSLFHFKRRRYQVIGNAPAGTLSDQNSYAHIFLGINRPWINPDSQFLAAMGKDIICKEYSSMEERVREICHSAVRYKRYSHRLTREENEKLFAEEENRILNSIASSLQEGGKLFSIQFGTRTVGIATVTTNRIDSLCIEGRFQRSGFGTQLLQYAVSLAGDNAYIDVPKTNTILLHICGKLENLQNTEDLGTEIRFMF